MTATIYYFSGTGNSLHAAKSIAIAINGTLSSMAGLASRPSVEDKSDIVGLVFPVYCYDAPDIVKEFIKKLKVNKEAYVFCVLTCGGGPGKTLHSVDGLLKENGSVLSSACVLEMPDNISTLFNMAPKPERLNVTLKAADDTLAGFIETIVRKEIKPFHNGYTPYSRMMSPLSHFGLTRLYRLSKKLKADEKCNACGICEKVCPVNNITRVDKKVQWGNNCTWCLACVHWCPQKAIQVGRWTKKGPRYNHPDIKIKDMLSK